MNLFVSYLRSRWRSWAVVAVCVGVFAASFALYHLPMAALVYPSGVCLLIGLAFEVGKFLKIRNTHRTLERLRTVTATAIRSLPPTDGATDGDYQAVIRHLQAEAAQVQTDAAARYGDMVDYYTAWAHQIKTPIASMKLTLQQEDSPFSRQLSAELFRIEQYVEMVLAFLRLDADTNDYVFRTHRLDDLIRPAVRRFAPDFIGRRLTLDYETVTDTVVTDEKWFSFVLEQVLSNALKYTKEGTIRIFYRADEKTLCIRDTGIGIAPEDIPRVFEKGYTGHNGRTDKSASGIGLYLCRRICRNLGIGIAVESEVGRGTTVSLDLAQYAVRPE